MSEYTEYPDFKVLDEIKDSLDFDFKGNYIGRVILRKALDMYRNGDKNSGVKNEEKHKQVFDRYINKRIEFDKAIEALMKLKQDSFI